MPRVIFKGIRIFRFDLKIIKTEILKKNINSHFHRHSEIRSLKIVQHAANQEQISRLVSNCCQQKPDVLLFSLFRIFSRFPYTGQDINIPADQAVHKYIVMRLIEIYLGKV